MKTKRKRVVRTVGGWPVPCHSEGKKENCKACWGSHSDAMPYCTSAEYKKLKLQLVTADA